MARLEKWRNVIIILVAAFCIIQCWKKRKTQRNKTMSERRNALTAKERDEYQKETDEMVKHARRVTRDAEMNARVVHLQTKCKTSAKQNIKIASPPTSYLKHVIVDQKNKMLFCYIPKVANTNFRRILLATSGVVSKETAVNISGYDFYTKYKDKLPLLRDFHHQKRKEMLQTYTKFMFVRQPMEKLLSGFKNKFFHPNRHESDRYYNAINRFYKKFSVLGKKRKLVVNATTQTITFTDFLTYWTDLYELGVYVDAHFELASTLCRPCTVSYDFIGKFESLSDDVTFIFDKLNIDMRFPERNDNYSAIKTVDVLQEYYKDVPKPLLRKVQNILSVDFELFGYNHPDWVV